MDIIQIIKDNLPEGTELSEKTVASIAKEIKKVQGDEFLPKEQYSKKTNELAEANATIADLQGKVADYDALSKALEDEKKAHVKEKAAHDATKAGHAAEKDAADIDSKVAAQLKASGMNVKAIDKALKLYDRAIVERDKDGNIKNANSIVEHFKADWADFFGTTETQGAEVGTPPATPPATLYTTEQLRSMSAEDINKNWTRVQESLKKGT